MPLRCSSVRHLLVPATTLTASLFLALRTTSRFPVFFSTTGMTSSANPETATLAAGCFWSVELIFQRLEGVETSKVGYIGGHVDKPTYEQVW